MSVYLYPSSELPLFFLYPWRPPLNSLLFSPNQHFCWVASDRVLSLLSPRHLIAPLLNVPKVAGCATSPRPPRHFQYLMSWSQQPSQSKTLPSAVLQEHQKDPTRIKAPLCSDLHKHPVRDSSCPREVTGWKGRQAEWRQVGDTEAECSWWC